MRIARVYVEAPLRCGATLVLPRACAEHLARVLRHRAGDAIVLFNGQGGEWEATIASIGRAEMAVIIGSHHAIERESPLRVTLAQGVARGERMDYTIQKAVELGVTRIVPIAARRSVVHLGEARAERRLDHWRKVIRHACEQCGRNLLPAIEPVVDLPTWLAGASSGVNVLLATRGETALSDLTLTEPELTLLAGPEGGWSEEEVYAARQAGFLGLRLGPRILRTETAAVAALSAFNSLWGDLR
ncbi:MAG: 16S rRNA (uracil(1498)-N(3))-methyltransferase [Gammaproteobacteria bacterium]